MFYEVQAKCGHVGRNNYVVKTFYVKAESASDAARQIRYAPRVKHNHKDAIISVKRIDHEQYVVGAIQMQNDEYFNVYNSSDQKRIVVDGIMAEECEEKEETRNVYFKLKKYKILEIASRKMIYGECYYG